MSRNRTRELPLRVQRLTPAPRRRHRSRGCRRTGLGRSPARLPCAQPPPLRSRLGVEHRPLMPVRSRRLSFANASACRLPPWQREAIDALLARARPRARRRADRGRQVAHLPGPGRAPRRRRRSFSRRSWRSWRTRCARSRRAAIPATFIASTARTPSYAASASRGCCAASYKLVYAAPERLASDAFVETLARCNVALVAVDEAHCIAQWGHDFRPDYLRIGTLLERLRPPRVLACTATATPEVRREIRAQLRLGDACREVLRGFARPNLHLAARNVDGVSEARSDVFAALASALGEPQAPNGGAIVYAATRKQTEQWAETLRAQGLERGRVPRRHARHDRTDVATRFADRSLDLVVATNAFGMGIDRADIRAVIARAAAVVDRGLLPGGGARGARRGRGLGPAPLLGRRHRACAAPGDDRLRRRAGAAPSSPRGRGRSSASSSATSTRAPAGTTSSCGTSATSESSSAAAATATSASPSTSARSTRCGEAERREAARIVRMALSAVARARQRAGLVAVAEMLRGVDGERTRRFGFTELSTFGLLRDRSRRLGDGSAAGAADGRLDRSRRRPSTRSRS